MTNLALYREYRPKTFDEVIGQDHIVKTLINQIKTNSLSHAYLFCGTRGTGKTSTAKIFAKAINCEHNENGSPCLKCQTCISLSNSSNLDLLEIDAASNNRVDEIRDLRDKVKYPPVNGKYKVYIIDEVHMLTDSAYNALLKTLEEPPKHAIFILCTTEVHKLPQTILSRCMKFDFRLVELEKLKGLLKKIFEEKNIKYEEEALHLIAQRGEGSVRDTLSIADLCVSFSGGNVTFSACLEALGASSSETLIKLTDGLIQNDGEKILTTMEQLSNHGKNFTILNKELISHIKNLLVIKTVKNSKDFLMVPQELYDEYKNQASKTSSENLLEYLEKLSGIETVLKYSLSPRTLLEITLLGLICEKKTIVDGGNENVEKKTNLESFGTNLDKKIDITKNFSDPFNKNSISTTQKEENKSCSFEVVAEILKTLREENQHLLLSILQNLEESEIDDEFINISFVGENYKEILEKIDNISLINDIIGKYNLKVKYKYINEHKTTNISDILKEKFENLEIK